MIIIWIEIKYCIYFLLVNAITFWCAESCILVCGDDKGALWVYDLADYVTGNIRSPITNGAPLPLQEPVKILEWPELEDAEVRRQRFNPLHTSIMRNCVYKCMKNKGLH